MGICRWKTMLRGRHLLALALLLVALGSIEVSGRRLDGGFNKRGLSDPNDPRNLFDSIYGINYKRTYEEPLRSGNDVVDLYDYYMNQAYAKRGLKDPNDPRNLFRAIYGYRK